MRAILFISLLLVLSAGQSVPVHAQTPVQPTPDQLIQLMRSQPAVDISTPVTATATFDPPLVQPGERAVYRVMLNAPADSVNWPEKLPAPASLKFHLSASGQNMQFLSGSYLTFATFVYDIRAGETGRFIIPEFTVEVYGKPVLVPSAQLEVKVGLPPHEPVRQLVVRPSATNVFIGEAFNVSVRLPANAAGGIEGVSDLQLTGDGFVTDKNSARQSFQMTGENGRRDGAYIYQTSITPITAGPLKLSAQGFTTGVQFGVPRVNGGQVSVSDGSSKYVLLDSEPVTINVRPIPVENRLPGFTGAVGSFTCDPPGLATNLLKVGEPVQLTVVIRGRKNLGRISPPPPPHAEDWQIFPAVRGEIVSAVGMNLPGVSFKYTLIPLTDAVSETPTIPFSSFDPQLGRYVDLTIPSIPVNVLAGEASTNADVPPTFSENRSESEQKSGLSQLASTPGRTTGSLIPLQLRGWFPLVQVLPVLGFCGLWFWDRRRRFLEQHPEIVRRRHAKRALRRELRLLEQDADAGLFVQRAINALQIASAPHYPAAPRALVCGDVLQILTATEREGKAGETVRRFFAAADASAFAISSEGRANLAAEKSDLKEILLKLEARL